MAKQKLPKDSKALALLCGRLAAEKNTTDIIFMNIAAIDGAPSDWFVVGTCASDPQMKAAALNVEVKAKALGVDIPRGEGWETNWIIVDFFDVVVHLMKRDARSFYKLEKLWSEAEMFTLSEAGRMIKYSPTKIAKAGADVDE